jgi:ABC-type multidrug transport system fused ATPase/permease subunit
MSTLGAIFSVYLSFMIPTLTLSLAWIISHIDKDPIYQSIIIPFLLMIIYLFVSAKRFWKIFTKSFIEEHRANLLNERIELALDGSSTAILDLDFDKDNFFISKSWS